jgi:predicted DNA binding CopG/RHH family protein
LVSHIFPFIDSCIATFRKDKRINIRISEKDLVNLQKKALQEGLPFQTLISSILHKYITGQFKEKVN